MASKLVVPVPVPIEAAAERVPLLSRQTVHLQTGAYNTVWATSQTGRLLVVDGSTNAVWSISGHFTTGDV